MITEGLITLTEGSTVGKQNALITDKGNTLMARYGDDCFRKYQANIQASESEAKRKNVEAEEREERNTRANEKNAKSSIVIAILTVLTVLITAFACWQTSKASEKDRIIEIQQKHIQQLETQRMLIPKN